MIEPLTKKDTTFIIIVGILSGIALQLSWIAASDNSVDANRVIFQSFAGSLFLPLLFVFMCKCVHLICKRLPISDSVRHRYYRNLPFTFLIFLSFFLGAWGLHLTKYVTVLIFVTWLFVQVLLLIYLIETEEHADAPATLRWITFLFLISGFAALIYQVVWQRILFTAFGVNIESIILIVSIFMFGLGIGSLVGGQFSKRFPKHLPLLFVICEVSIGLFGLISIPLIEIVSRATMQLSVFYISAAVYGLLSIPTLLMGATLPILVTYLHQHYGHVGKSVSNLYWVNTIGSAFASLLTVSLLFRLGGLQSAVWVAAILNMFVGGVVYYYTRRHLQVV